MASLPRDVVTTRDSGFESLKRPEGWTRKAVIAALVALGTFAAAWLLIRLLPVLLVFVGALFLIGTLNPIVEWVEGRGVKRNVAVGVVFGGLLVVVLGGLVGTAAPLIVQVSKLFEQAPRIRDQLAELLGRSHYTASLVERVKQAKGISEDQLSAAFVFSAHAAEIVGYTVSSVFIALYLMLDRDRARGALYAFVARRHHMKLTRVLMRLEQIVGGYIRGQVITSVLMTVFTLTLLIIAGVDAALPIALFAGLADVLPYIGVFLSVGPAVLATIASGAVWTFVVLGTMLAYEELESRLIVPKVYGNALRLPSWVVLVALLGGGVLGGIFGAIVALPVAAAIVMLVEELVPRLPGETPTPEQEAERARLEDAQSDYDHRTEGMPARQSAAIAFELLDGAYH
ncbi:MAG TPA: AI-2E family transporter [Polyangiaceae bacterium]|jgi:predicted PurR-regulated permease PerM|nr:AI-2E family transporter [Polyangiaceae bacterium]